MIERKDEFTENDPALDQEKIEGDTSPDAPLQDENTLTDTASEVGSEPVSDVASDAVWGPVSDTEAESPASEGEKENKPEDSESANDVQAPVVEEVYRWTYADQRAHDANTATVTPPSKGKRVGTVIAILLVAAYMLCTGILAGILLSRNSVPVDFSDETVALGGLGEKEDTTDVDAVDGVAKARGSVVVITVKTATGSGTGTGIVLTEDGYIATNHHVVDGATSITVQFFNGQEMQATLRGSSEPDDLAVIKVNATGLTPATFATSAECYVGQPVYAIGTPAGVEYRWTTTRGIISYVDREVKIYDDFGTLTKKLKLLQTDAMVNPGNSGGPLVNTDGEVVGIISMKLAGEYEGIGFAIPSDGAVEIINAIILDGNADGVNSSISSKRPLIGITGVYIEAETYYKEISVNGVTQIAPASRYEISNNPDELIYSDVAGFYVSDVSSDGGASGKLEVGDVIVEINDTAIESREDLANEINDHYAGDSVTVKFYRDGEYYSVDIMLGEE